MVRSPMQVDDGFRERMKKLQKEIMKKKGEFTSIPKITKKIVQIPEWQLIENKILNDSQSIEFRINFDRRQNE